MIFMSQSGLTDATREHEWDSWYFEHLSIMRTVAGFDSAQRFKLLEGDNSPSLAMYSVASPEVFRDPRYLNVRGMGEWIPLIDQRHYRRNLFAGVDHAPYVGDSQLLLVADRNEPDPDLDGATWTWLEAVAIDRSTPWRGIALADRGAVPDLRGKRVDVYCPVSDPTPK